MNPNGGSGGGASQPRPPPHGLHLACRECQRKKIKCDRTYPCGQCSRAGFSCMASTRKPRAKTGAKAADAELRQRIAKLEKLVETFQGEEEKDGSKSGGSQLPSAAGPQYQSSPQPSNSSDSKRSNSTGSPGAIEPGTTAINKYVAGGFWSSLTNEVKALADAFEENDLEEEESTSPETTPPSAAFPVDGSNSTAGYELIFCPPGVLYVMPGAAQEPDGATAALLFNSYLEHVEPVQKLFHVPTLRPFMEQGAPYLGQPSDAPCNKALKMSLYFAGANSLIQEESLAMFGKPTEQVVNEFRRSVDIALYQADPLNTNELATLQALLLYTTSIRVYDMSRRAWSMVGLVARIARAMNIHREMPGESPYLAELRRRCWGTIVFLDCYSSIDRGSEPAIHPETFSRLPPTNLNDADFDENSLTIVPRRGEITDMSLACVAMEGSLLSVRMALPEGAPNDPKAWQRRLDLAHEYTRKIQEEFLQYCDPNNLMHQTIAHTATAASHSVMLRAVRPMHYHPSTPPPRVDSPWVMQLALNILRNADDMWKRKTFSGQWRRMPWVPWHAISVTLAGLCSIRGTEVADEAWSLVDKSMERYGNHVADSRNGMLWKPVEKLYRKAAAFRDGQEHQPPPAPQPVIPTPESFDLPNATGEPVISADSSLMMDNMNMNLNMPITAPMAMPESVFDFPPEMQAALPIDNSWLDWEAMMKDMDDLKADEMQWM